MILLILIEIVLQLIMQQFFDKNNYRKNEDTHSYHRVRGLYFLVVIFAATMFYGDLAYHNQQNL